VTARISYLLFKGAWCQERAPFFGSGQAREAIRTIGLVWQFGSVIGNSFSPRMGSELNFMIYGKTAWNPWTFQRAIRI
jgi:hypothetical protein